MGHDDVEEMPQKWRRRKEELLSAAEESLKLYGLAKTTIDDIAKLAGVSKTSLYYYFENKEDLLRAVVAHKSTELLRKIQGAVASTRDPAEKLRSFVKARYRYLQELRTYLGFPQELATKVSPRIKAQRDGYFEKELEVLLDILREGKRRGIFAMGDEESLGRIVIAGLWGFDFMLLFYGQEVPVERDIDGFLDALLWGLVPRK